MWTVTTIEDHQLIVIKSDCVFNYQRLLELLGKVYIDNDCKILSYNGFADLSGIEIIDADINSMVETIQQYTHLTPQFSGVKVAVCLPHGLIGSLAQIYKIITLDNTQYNLQIYSSVVECAAYLQVDKDLLTA